MSVVNLFQNIAGLLSSNLNFSEPSLFNDSDYFSLAALDFSESGLKIKQILESVYTDGITGLDDVEVKGQNIVGTFSDYISPALTNKFSFEITPDNVNYQIINPGATSYSESLDFATVAKPIVDSALKTKADKSGRTRNCTTGKTMPCGARCQAIGKPCKGQPLAPELKQVQADVIAAAEAAGVAQNATLSAEAPSGNTTSTKKPSLIDIAKQKAQERSLLRQQNIANLQGDKRKPAITDTKKTDIIIPAKAAITDTKKTDIIKPPKAAITDTKKTDIIKPPKETTNDTKKADTIIPAKAATISSTNKTPTKSEYAVDFNDHTDIAKLGDSFTRKFTQDFEGTEFAGKFKALSGLSKTIENNKVSLKGELKHLRGKQAKGEALDQSQVNSTRKLSANLIKQQELYDKTVKQIGMTAKFDGLREAILAKHGISKESAIAAVGKLNFEGNNLTTKGDKLDMAKEDLADVYRFTGGKGFSSIKTVTAEQDRASANPHKGTLDMGKESKREIVYHEFAHHVEVGVPGLANAARDWIESRATSTETKKLSEITGNKAFRDSEKAMPDTFISPYVGKIYGKRGTSTEVISMGVERLHSADSMMKFYLQDPDHFKFVIGAILGDHKA